jgi:hypothetical protein
MSAHIPLLNFLVGLGAFGVLIWYALETMKLRKAAMEQVESMAKPCLTLRAKLRNAADAILDMDDAVGAMVVRGEDAQFVVQNIGTGIALNVSYQFRSLDTPERPDHPRYLFYVLLGQPVQLPETLNASPYVGNCEALFRFQSISGRWYQSTVTMSRHVLTKFDFRPIKTNANGVSSSGIGQA